MTVREFLWPRACLWCGVDLSPRLVSDCNDFGFKFQFFEPLLNRVICGDCFLSVADFRARCLVCGLANATGRTCRGCQPKSPLNGRIAAVPYGDPLVQQAIAVFKYGLVTELAEPLAVWLAERLRQVILHERPRRTGLTVVPLHPRRERWRGFNQATLLANKVGQELALDTLSLLERRTSGPALAKLPVAERLRYIAGAFQQNEAVPARIKRLIIVDDVWGSGATLTAAAWAVRRHWSGEIWAAVVAA